MRFNVSAVSAAILSAICLTVPFVANAAINSAPPRFFVTAEPCGGHTNNVFQIRNDGGLSSVTYYKITARAAEGMPALKTWNMRLFPLAKGQVFYVQAPRDAWGLKLSLEISSDWAGTQILANSGEKLVSYPNFCW